MPKAGGSNDTKASVFANCTAVCLAIFFRKVPARGVAVQFSLHEAKKLANNLLVVGGQGRGRETIYKDFSCCGSVFVTWLVDEEHAAHRRTGRSRRQGWGEHKH